MQRKFKWNNIEIIKNYFKTLSKYDEDSIIDSTNLSDMILFSILKIYEIYGIQNYKTGLGFDKFFMDQNTSDFEKSKIEDFIKIALDKKVRFAKPVYNFDENKMLGSSFSFLGTVDNIAEKELSDAIFDKRLYIRNCKILRNYAGTTYSISHNPYYEILQYKNENSSLTLTHEIMHGYINKLTDRKFYKDGPRLYRELVSLLSEIYQNDYLYKNQIISFEEYVTNINDTLLANVTEKIEILDILFKLSKLENVPEKSEIDNLIKRHAIKNPDYNFTIKELICTPLESLLSYLYPFMIAVGIYENNKDDSKEGIKTAIEIMKNVNFNNEKDLLDYYKINVNESYSKFVDENNLLVEKAKGSI